jgi:hypothetical protein
MTAIGRLTFPSSKDPSGWTDGRQCLRHLFPSLRNCFRSLQPGMAWKRGNSLRPTQRRWSCQENALRDWFSPLNLDTNHGYAKEHVVNSELVKRQRVAQGRQQRLQRLAQTCRGRLTDLQEQDQELQEQVHAYEQRWREFSLQLMLFEATGQSEEREYFPDLRAASGNGMGSTSA